MECNSATSSDKLVLCHFSQQIFQALGYPDKKTAILKKKWRVAVRASQFQWLSNFYDPKAKYISSVYVVGNGCSLFSSVLCI